MAQEESPQIAAKYVNAIFAVIEIVVAAFLFFRSIAEMALAEKIIWIAFLLIFWGVFEIIIRTNKFLHKLVSILLENKLKDEEISLPQKIAGGTILLLRWGFISVLVLFLISILFKTVETKLTDYLATPTSTGTATATATRTLTPTITFTPTFTSTATATFTPTPISAKSRYYMIVLDASRNMNERFGDGTQTKWEAVLASVRYMLNTYVDEANFGLVVVGGQGEDIVVNPCDAPTTPLIPFISPDGNLLPKTGFPKQDVITQLSQLRPSGGGAFDEAFIVAKKQLENLPANTTNMLLYFTGTSDTCESENEWINLTRIIRGSNDLASYREIIVLTENIDPEMQAFADFVNQLSANTNIQVPQNQDELDQSVTVVMEQVEAQIQEQARAIASAQPPPLTPYTPTVTRTPTRTPTMGPSPIPPTQTPPPFIPTSTPANWSCSSSDGRYGALQVGLHYQVIDIQTNSQIFTSSAKYGDANDAKACEFSGDMFAAAYHYTDNGDYTWIGGWRVTGEKLYEKEKPGFTTDFSGVFDGP